MIRPGCRGPGARAVSAALLTAAAVALALPPLLGAQRAGGRADAPTFSTDVQYVEVDVRVTDAQGRFVGTLTPADFVVTEDGRRQEIAAFQLIDRPHAVRAASAPAATAGRLEPDAASNLETAEGRVFVVVLDDLHTDASRSGAVRTAVRQFVDRYVGPADLVSIVQTSGRSDANQEFTSRPSLLMRAAEMFIGRKLPSNTLARQDAYEQQRDRESRADLRLQHVADPLDAERGRNAEIMLEALQRVGRWLVDTRGRRKALLLVSEGIDYDVLNRAAQTRSGLSTATSKSSTSVAVAMQEAVAALTRANVAVYGIDPRGFATGGDVLVESGMPPQNPALDLGPTAIQDEVVRAQASLRLLAEETGGAAVTSNELAQALDRVMRENSTYYLLAYQPTPARYDGKFRRIEVRVMREGLRVQARRGYVAATSRAAARPPSSEIPGQPSIVLQRLLNRPLPVAGIPLRVTAAPFKGLGGLGSVLLTIEIDARDFRFLQAGGVHTDRIEAAVVALDNRSQRLRGDRHDVTLRLKPDTYVAVRDHGVRLLFRLELPAGRYQLRAAVSEEGAGAMGSVHCDVEIPDFAAAPLASSGIVLTSTAAVAMPTARTDPDIEQLLKTPPTSVRAFAATDTLGAAFALYHRPRAPVGMVDITTSVIDQHGAVRFTQREEASQAELETAPDGYGYVAAIPLAPLTAGAHVLRVEASARADRTITTRRELSFVVEPR